MAFAQNPSLVPFTLFCPTVGASGSHAVLNDGVNISGYGSERINNNSTANNPFFTAAVPAGANIPVDLATGSYANSGTSYDSATGMVTCSFASTGGFDSFSINYVVTGGAGALVKSSAVNKITIQKFMGSKA